MVQQSALAGPSLLAGFGAASTIALALCHVALVPTTVVGLLALRGGRL